MRISQVTPLIIVASCFLATTWELVAKPPQSAPILKTAARQGVAIPDPAVRVAPTADPNINAPGLPIESTITPGAIVMAVNRTTRVADRIRLPVFKLQELVFRDGNFEPVDVAQDQYVSILPGLQFSVLEIKDGKFRAEYSGARERYSGWIRLDQVTMVRPAIEAGDTVVVVNDNARFRRSDMVELSLKRGERLHAVEKRAAGEFGSEPLIIAEGGGAQGEILARDVKVEQPIVKKGDLVEVVNDNVKMISGDGVVLVLDRGERMKVRELQTETQGGDWFLATTSAHGRPRAGWVSLYNVKVLKTEVTQK